MHFPSRLRETPTSLNAHGHLRKIRILLAKNKASENDRGARSPECLPHVPNKNRNRAQLTAHISMLRSGTNSLTGRQHQAYKVSHCCYNSMSSQRATKT